MKTLFALFVATSWCAAQPAFIGAHGFTFGSSEQIVQNRAGANGWTSARVYRDDLLVFRTTRSGLFTEIEFWFSDGALDLIRTRSNLRIIEPDLKLPPGIKYELDEDDDDRSGIDLLPVLPDDHSTIRIYQRLVDTVMQHFGSPALSLREARGAVLRGDERDINTVRLGRVVIADEWRIPTNDGATQGLIRAEILMSGDIQVTYQAYTAPSLSK